MISIIICSINKTFAEQVQQSISKTIGVTYEVIVLDNTINPKGISAVYNEGGLKAKYDILCFIHEDLLFETKNWGKILLDAFSANSRLGLIGVAGSNYKSKGPSGWFTGIKEHDFCNINHLNNTNQVEKIYFNPNPNVNLQPAVVLDGVFLATRKNVWQTIRFDEKLLTGFHLYDIDFSFRVAKEYDVAVTFNIDMIHIVKGAHFNNNWLTTTLAWHELMSSSLPFFSSGDKSFSKIEEIKIVKTWLIRLKHEKLSLVNKFKWLFRSKVIYYPSLWIFLPLFFLKSYLSRK
jgi:hypothetical protein